MADQIELRPATVDDAIAIVDIIRSGFAPELLDKFIFGCAGISRYVREQIIASDQGGETRFTMVARSGTPIGCCELRRLRDRLFLNYIAVLPDARSAGLGRRLLHAGIDRTADASHKTISLDVLEGNRVAVDWYRSLGFERGHVTEWWELPIAASNVDAGTWVTGLPQASVCQEAFGFSRVTVSTANGTWEVGLLGASWFRITEPAALEDPNLLATLHRLDPDRELLALLPEGALPRAARRATRATGTHRMTMDLAALRALLENRSR